MKTKAMHPPLATIWLRCLLSFFSAFCLMSGCRRSEEPIHKPDQSATAANEPPVEVRTIHPFKGDITRGITLPGEVKPYQQATLYAKVAGYLKTIAVDKGDQVQAGALLAEIEVPELLADHARYRAEVEVTGIDFKRLSESQKKAPDLVMPQTVDDARGKWDVAKAELERVETLLK